MMWGEVGEQCREGSWQRMEESNLICVENWNPTLTHRKRSEESEERRPLYVCRYVGSPSST